MVEALLDLLSFPVIVVIFSLQQGQHLTARSCKQQTWRSISLQSGVKVASLWRENY